MKTKRCGRCKEVKALSYFQPYKSGIHKGRYHSYCKECDNEYRKIHMTVEQRRAQQKRYILKNPQRRKVIRARWYKKWAKNNRTFVKKIHSVYNHVRRSLRRGELKKLPCVACGSKKTMAHHWDYDKPLEISWLCPLHHRWVHSIMPKRRYNP